VNCRHCSSPIALQFLDLGTAPPSNAYLSATALRAPERWYPLRVFVCEQCWLVQTEDYARAEELFDPQYAYFSAVSRSWLDHCERFVGDALRRFSIDSSMRVVEIAANDGYLLQYVASRGVRCTGIEPTASTAAAARAKGLEIVEEFFGRRLAQSLVGGDRAADLTVANNVLAHVPDINDFVAGFTILLKHDGVATFEFPHLPRLVAGRQFDTVYHEHFSYLSLTSVERIFAANGLAIFDVEELGTHGGSLRVYAQRAETGRRSREASVDALLHEEERAGLRTGKYYRGFQGAAERVKNDFLQFLLEAKRSGKAVSAYGAAAKGNTLLNFAGVRPDILAFVADRSPAKQGRFMPGSRIPILGEDAIAARRPDFVVILPWNLRAEICSQLEYAREWGCRFVTAVPELRIC
jgi:2-polyprenyl-3-methyl-5-hydroxy-6-metoxy-1,4-benzoquinol methylase